MKIVWYGHACFLIETNGVRILIDPYPDVDDDEIGGVDYILVTHEHSDHYGKTPLLARLRKAKVIGPKPVYLMAISDGLTDVQAVEEGQEIELKNGVKIKAIYAEHPSSQYPLGYLIIGERRVWHTGDTYYTPLFKKLKGMVDILLVPISGRSTANEREAADIVETVRPKIVIPMHYGVYGEGSTEKLQMELRTRRVWTLVRPLKVGEVFHV
ncbi:MAG TPA: MBL fold metallo-hydrolase [Thermococcus paralvinellae]|uniref:MBL fold metallo-hydrolase n=1 Tax=Thermococcus paralvinellae TaxID=582419 RepID=A0A833E3E1_9EURY|nr:MBL fold metallo-hydrolase [Thermococcus paralvinellae]